MSITKKLQIKKAQWKEFVRCLKLLRVADAAKMRTEDAIHLKKSYNYDINETGWTNGSCLVTHTYPGMDMYGEQMTMQYHDTCAHFQSCDCTECEHYKDWVAYQDAQKSYVLAKIELKEARKKLFAKVK